MRRLLRFLLRNWPLKLGAIVLATVLYGGVVLSENTRTWRGQVGIDVLNPPPNAALLDNLGYVTNVQYRAPLDVQLSTNSFQATVDLSHVQPQVGGPAVEEPVQLVAIDGRVQIVDYSPRTVNVRVDPVVTRQLPVTVDHGIVPEALSVGPPQVDPSAVSVTGANSRVSSVHSVTARVTIDASGLNVDQDVDLIAADENGNQVPGVELSPSRVHVRIVVARQLANATLPVIPKLTGNLAPGYQVTAVSVDPVTVTVSGEAPTVQRLAGVSTVPIDLGGHTSLFSGDVPLDLPAGVSVDGPSTVRVTVTVGLSQASRTLEVAVQPTGMRPDLAYDIAASSVLVTVSGPQPSVDALAPSDVQATVDVAQFGIGTHLGTVVVTVPSDISLVGVAPTQISVDVQLAPHLTPSPIPLPSPVPSPTPFPGPPTASPSLAPS